jgi:hypothetical protein
MVISLSRICNSNISKKAISQTSTTGKPIILTTFHDNPCHLSFNDTQTKMEVYSLQNMKIIVVIDRVIIFFKYIL